MSSVTTNNTTRTITTVLLNQSTETDINAAIRTAHVLDAGQRLFTDVDGTYWQQLHRFQVTEHLKREECGIVPPTSFVIMWRKAVVQDGVWFMPTLPPPMDVKLIPGDALLLSIGSGIGGTIPDSLSMETLAWMFSRWKNLPGLVEQRPLGPQGTSVQSSGHSKRKSASASASATNNRREESAADDSTSVISESAMESSEIDATENSEVDKREDETTEQDESSRPINDDDEPIVSRDVMDDSYDNDDAQDDEDDGVDLMDDVDVDMPDDVDIDDDVVLEE